MKWFEDIISGTHPFGRCDLFLNSKHIGVKGTQNLACSAYHSDQELCRSTIMIDAEYFCLEVGDTVGVGGGGHTISHISFSTEFDTNQRIRVTFTFSES